MTTSAYSLVQTQQRVSLPLTQDLVDGIEDFLYETRQGSRVRATNELLRLGLKEAETCKRIALEKGKIKRSSKPTIPFDIDLLDQVQDFRYRPEIRVDTATAAIRTLLRLGLGVYHQRRQRKRAA